MSGPRNQDPSIIQDAAEMVGGLLSQYGWFLLLGIAVLCALYYYFQPLLHSRLAAWTQRKAEVLHISDPETVQKRHEAMHASRMQMQQQMDAASALFMEKQKMREEEKRREKILAWERSQEGMSHRGQAKLSQAVAAEASASTVSQPQKKTLRPNDHNPLDGSSGSSCGWRQGRRGPTTGGG
uniref:Selenoprotein S n=1 Tax=Eptatretus burgeri TaxID=7764 RepID=A0A8C4QN83_EPTBU